VLARYPRLVAHLICESLGYMTPSHAAFALLCYMRREPHFCEWYDSLASNKKPHREAMWDVTKSIPGYAFRNRHRHKGYMAEYAQARALVDHANATGREPELASWF